MRVHLPPGPRQGSLRAFSPVACDTIAHMFRVHGLRRRLARVHLTWNMRLTSTAGRAWFCRNEIELSGRLWHVATPAQRRDVAAHEAAHLVAFHAHGHEGHGPPWQDVMHEAGFVPSRQHDISPGFPVACACPAPGWASPQRVVRLLQGLRVACTACRQPVRLMPPLDRLTAPLHGPRRRRRA